jgi:hypothetical protein
VTASATTRPLQYVLQALCYGAFVAFVGYFSTSPAYRVLAPDRAMVRLSLQHAGERKEACRERTPEELAKLAPNMRAATVCPRERAPVVVQVEMDGQTLFDVIAPPSGLARDGASIVYRRAAIPAGQHRFVARLKDSVAGPFRVEERTVDLRPGRVLVLDFAAGGGWIFRS